MYSIQITFQYEEKTHFNTNITLHKAAAIDYRSARTRAFLTRHLAKTARDQLTHAG
jgi:hypothetical protein